MILYRPVGLEELVLIYRAELRQFPPRLPEQPIFYPVLSQDYATQIARDWNTKSGSLAGYVTAFDVDDGHARSFAVQRAGANEHRELWVPAGALEEFNRHIHGRIRLIAACFGETFSGLVAGASSLRGKNAREQLDALRGIHEYSLLDFHGEITANGEAVFAHYPYWEQVLGAGDALLRAMQQVWASAFPGIPLGVQVHEQGRRVCGA